MTGMSKHFQYTTSLIRVLYKIHVRVRIGTSARTCSRMVYGFVPAARLFRSRRLLLYMIHVRAHLSSFCLCPNASTFMKI